MKSLLQLLNETFNESLNEATGTYSAWLYKDVHGYVTINAYKNIGSSPDMSELPDGYKEIDSVQNVTINEVIQFVNKHNSKADNMVVSYEQPEDIIKAIKSL